MDNTELTIEFGEHVPSDQVASMLTGLAAYGNVSEGSNTRQFQVSVFRRSKLPDLKSQLVKWERYGFLQWHDAT